MGSPRGDERAPLRLDREPAVERDQQVRQQNDRIGCAVPPTRCDASRLPSPGADVVTAGPVPVPMWHGRARSRCRCGLGRTAGWKRDGQAATLAEQTRAGCRIQAFEPAHMESSAQCGVKGSLQSVTALGCAPARDLQPGGARWQAEMCCVADGLHRPIADLHPRDWAHPRHICTGIGLAAATSAPGLGKGDALRRVRGTGEPADPVQQLSHLQHAQSHLHMRDIPLALCNPTRATRGASITRACRRGRVALTGPRRAYY